MNILFTVADTYIISYAGESPLFHYLVLYF